MPATTTTVGVRYMIDDVADAVAFYTTHLGFAVEQDAAPAFASVSRDGVRLMLSGPTSSGRRPMPDGTRPVPGGWNRLHLQVADLPPRSTGSAVKAAGSATTSSAGPAARRSCWRTPPATWSSCSNLPGDDPAAGLGRPAGHYPCRTDRQQRQRLPAHVVVYYAAPRAPRLSTT